MVTFLTSFLGCTFALSTHGTEQMHSKKESVMMFVIWYAAHLKP